MLVPSEMRHSQELWAPAGLGGRGSAFMVAVPLFVPVELCCRKRVAAGTTRDARVGIRED